MKMQIGTAYYPEQWDIDRVRIDAELMREAGVDFVRIGEFAWSRLEPVEGDFQLDHMLESIRIFAANGIRIIMCTPGATAPAWLVRKHPEILVKSADGKPAWFGVRQHTCYLSPVYRDYLAKIDEEIAKALTGCPNLLGFQIENEIGHTIFGLCHCEVCQAGFRDWLRERYETVEKLNRAWGNGFWSQDYSDWQEIRLGDMGLKQGASHVQDSIRFHSDSKCSYLKFQLDILRKYHPDTLITTNSMAGIANRHEAYAMLDRAALDCYPVQEGDAGLGAPADLFAGMKAGAPYWVLETGIGGHLLPGVPHNRRMKSHYWSYIAHGAELISIFWWRNALSGYEKDLVGIVGHNGKPRRRYEEFKNWIAEVRHVFAETGELALPAPQAAIIFDHENHWGYASGHWSRWSRWEEYVASAHGSCAGLHIETQVISPQREFAGFKLVILVSAFHIDKDVADRLKKFVHGGGIVIATGQTATQDDNANFLPVSGPENLSDLFGITIEDYIPDVGRNAGVAFSGTFNGSAAISLVDVEVTDAEVLAAFDNTDLAGRPAVTIKQYGQGYAIHVNASETDDASFDSILAYAAKRAAIELPNVPAGVTLQKRGNVTFLINQLDEELVFPYSATGTAVLGQYRDGRVLLPPYGVCIIKK